MSIVHFVFFSFLFIGISFVNVSYGWSIDDIDPVVSTRYGQIRGRRDTPVGNYPSDLRITSFIGIPYASPPVGIGRFSNPKEPEKWSGFLDATNRRVMCPQVEQRFRLESDPQIGESEDCLYLNVQVLTRGSVTVNAPVVVYLHGGEFKYGGKDFYYLDVLPQNLNSLVFVTINYRLGPLGFLSTDTNEVHGNYGLRDIIMALQWVQSEISQFHGDTNSVILMGHDAGAIAANMLMLSTYNKVYFNAVVCSGGTVFTPWAFEHQPSIISRELALSLGCGYTQIRRCLQQKSTSEILAVARTKRLHFRPTIDRNLSDPLFRDEPHIQFENGFFTRVPLIVGITEQEGALDYYRNYRQIQAISKIQDKIRYLIEPFVRRYANLDVLAALAHYQYFPEEEARSGRQTTTVGRGYNQGQVDERLVQVLGDFLYSLPAEKALQLHSSHNLISKFYVYEDKQPRITFGMLQRNLPSDVTADKFRATHMDDIFILFKTIYSKQYAEANPAANTLLSCILSTLKDKEQTCNWQNYQTTTRSYIRVTRQGSNYGNMFRSERMVAFWNHLFSTVEASTVVIPPYFPEAEFQSYQAATWSLVAIVVILLLLSGGLAAVIFIKRRNDKQSLKLIRKRNEEFTEKGDVVEQL
ncbi:acylcarnitine hydrolase [Tetranychus urticae]|uniref:Carboxylesterase type B domain-containing protein n=1 Tax=Tetranychus urticae TaxID=32264 RepID=T1JWI9_TETUR|nr:acylcarnitine hydrolase [Tetranychus urticae]